MRDVSGPPSTNPPGPRPTTGTSPATLEANRRDSAHTRARRTSRAVAIVATGAAAALGLVVSKEIPGASASAQTTVSSTAPTSSGTGGTTTTTSSGTSASASSATSSGTPSTTPSSTTKSATVVSGGTGR